jgi:hypothetical protein
MPCCLCKLATPIKSYNPIPFIGLCCIFKVEHIRAAYTLDSSGGRAADCRKLRVIGRPLARIRLGRFLFVSFVYDRRQTHADKCFL